MNQTTLLLALVFAVAPKALSSQLALSFRKLVTLSFGADAPLGLTSRSVPVRLADGGYLVAPLTDVGRLARFDSAGKLVHLLGRRGEGPGEFGGVITMMSSGNGRVTIIDNLRVTQLAVSKEAESVEKQIVGSGFEVATPVGKGEFLTTTLLLPSSRLPAFRLRNGDSLNTSRTFADPFRDLDGDIVARHIAPAGDGHVVISAVTAYEFATLDVSTGQWTLLKVSAPPFKSRRFLQVDRRQADVARPYSRVLALAMAGKDTLLVLYSMARKDWAPNPPPNATRERAPISPTDMPNYMDYYIDVLDVRTGVSLARQVLPGQILGFVTPRIAFGYRAMPDGDIGLQLYAIDLKWSKHNQRR
jgi:hypothetical protein